MADLFANYLVPFIIFISILSITIGSISALYQTKIKRFLAFSAITNMGYLFIGFSCPSLIGQVAIIYYLILYNFNLVNLFGILLVMTHRIVSKTYDDLVESISFKDTS